MPPKDLKKGQKTPTTEKSSTITDFDEIYGTPWSVSVSLMLQGEIPGPGEWSFLVVFNGYVVIETKWHNEQTLNINALPLKAPYALALIADRPLTFLLRALGGKGAKDPDPLLNLDNRAGASVDLFPLLLGERQIFTRVPLILLTNGQNIGCKVQVKAYANEPPENHKIPLMLTMISGHCLPVARDGTVYLSAIGLDGILEPKAVNFGMSLSTLDASKIVWASASQGGFAANTPYSVPNEDKFVPNDLELRNMSQCNSVYWYAMKRVLVDPYSLQARLSSPFLIEVAGVPRTGKIEVRGRYMGFVDAKVLLEPGLYGVSICIKLLYYNEADLPENVGPLLELPPTSAKVSARETDIVTDAYGHTAFVVLRFDLMELMAPKAKIATLFDIIGFPLPDGPIKLMDELYVDPPPEDPVIDVRRIRKEGGALAVHKELSCLACRGAVPMNQGIKRTAANRLLMRVRYMLKQFSLGDCSYIEWQDTVTGQHSASRRAVTSSFAPQPPPVQAPSRVGAARCRMAKDNRIADYLVNANLKALPGHPRALLCKALRCLEARNDSEARRYILEALSAQTKNRFLLWIFGGQEFDKGEDSVDMAAAAFRIAVKGDYSNGTTSAIGWAALHALYHFNEKYHAAFVAAQRMRKSYELSHEWKTFLERWIETSGEEEIFWIPAVVASYNPILMAAAFFLCLRCYSFSESLLKCVEEGCATRGSRLDLRTKITVDLYYIRAASLLLRRQLDKALEITLAGIKRFGPSANMSQMRAICLSCIHGWDDECENALKEAERAGCDPCPSLLLQAALGGLNSNPQVSLQRAARAHKIAPGAHTALAIGRIYTKLGENVLAERWAAVAVKTEPSLADGWAFLSILAMYQRDVEKARTMMRTARQVGPISADIEEELNKLMTIVKIELLPDKLLKNLCFCEYY